MVGCHISVQAEGVDLCVALLVGYSSGQGLCPTASRVWSGRGVC